MSENKGKTERIEDVQAKIIARDKRVIAQILHDYIPEYRGIPVEEIVRKYLTEDAKIRQRKVMPALLPGSNTDGSISGEGSVIYDVIIDALAPAAKDAPGPEKKDTIRIIFNFEVQNNPHPGYPLPMRSEFYTARMLSQQYGVTFAKSDYKNLRKVYSVWIVPYAPSSWGNNVLIFPGEHEPRALMGKNHYAPNEYGLMNYVLLEIGRPQELEENKDAMGLLSVLFSLTIGRKEQAEKLREEFDFKLETREEEELLKMQAMLSINEVYKERVEAELKSLREQLRVQKEQAEAQLRAAGEQAMMSIDAAYKERVEAELKDLREQLRVQKEQAEAQLRVQKEQAEAQLREKEQAEAQLHAAEEQAIESYIEAGVKYNVDQNILREDLKAKFDLSDAAAAAAIEAAMASQTEQPS